MEWWEVHHFISGLRSRDKKDYVQTRLLAWMVHKTLGGKTSSAEELLPFPWEKEIEITEEDREALDALIEECKRENAANEKAEG